MSTETERLAREAEARRNHLDDTLDQLQSKFSASAIVDELANYVKNGQGADMFRNLGRQARDNPVALGLIGAGVAWLMLGRGVRSEAKRMKQRYSDWDEDRHASSDFDREERDYRTRDSDSRAYSYDEDRASPEFETADWDKSSGEASSKESLLHKAKDKISDLASTASDLASNAKEALHSHAGTNGSGGMSDKARHLAREAAQRARRSSRYVGTEARHLAQTTRRKVVTTVQDEPLLVGAIALAIGAAIGAALPATRKENELLGKTRDQLRDEAVNYGKQTVDRVKHVAEEALHAADHKAGEVGLKPDGGQTLAEKVAEVASATVEAARKDAEKQGLL